ncbi:hypothetical protein GUITHDRAFT_142261 [Guillardia theta CCMP2712]|uniref:Uncharacterized protein n=1 Tax=Guillardia theta (strain CCMP2712) TaxID=905079 RepID=L1IYX2_GUITC|nr:hypothetical protein GUITHDRAFT_142261 [Guillardia theta CCMP2712]EKX41104.1 hypothetical protein GUITHDRAFT_142261 [Guillardia theta CCMP2712]|eukprot:XP_005828084.1 hypothetical protein GUITHDRAFT_142261 [Guillardia theta CCMP2712]
MAWGGSVKLVTTVAVVCCMGGERRRMGSSAGKEQAGHAGSSGGYYSRSDALGSMPCSSMRRLRGGGQPGPQVGPSANLSPEPSDINVFKVDDKRAAFPDFVCIKSALRRKNSNIWNGRRIFIRCGKKEQEFLAHRSHFMTALPPFILTCVPGIDVHDQMTASTCSILSLSKVQLWGKWEFQGESIGIFQGLFLMHTVYGPYNPLMLIENKADILFEQCEIRNLGGKCIVMRQFAEVTMDRCTVGGTCGCRPLPNHFSANVSHEDLVPRIITSSCSASKEKRKKMSTRIDPEKHWAPGGWRFASDGISVESGSWLIAKKVLFEDTGRADHANMIVLLSSSSLHISLIISGGVALRLVGHARANLFECRFQRNRVHLAADATVVMDLEKCDTFEFDEKRKDDPRYHGDVTNFYAHRAIRLPGNGTAILEAQDPDPLSGRKWREVNTLNRYWTPGAAVRGVDPYKKIKRDKERKERKELKAKLRLKYEAMGYPGIPKDVVTRLQVIAVKRRDFTAFTRPKSRRKKVYL